MSYIEKMCFVNWRFRSFVQYICIYAIFLRNEFNITFAILNCCNPNAPNAYIEVYILREMFKNNVDYCYKKLSSHHRLIQTIPFRFGNRMRSENAIFVLILFILLIHGLFILPW